MWQIWLFPFTEAWEMLLDIPLPKVFRNNTLNEYEQEDFSDYILLCFPVVGLVVGLGVWLVSKIFLLLAHQTVAAVLTGITVAILLELAFSGRNLAALISFTENIFKTKNVQASLISLKENFQDLYNSPVASLTTVIIILLRIFLIGLIVYYDFSSWLVIAITLNYSVQAQLALTQKIGSYDKFFEIHQEKTPFYVWGIAAIILLIMGFCYLQAVITSFVIAFCFAMLFQRHCEDKLDGIDGKIICLAGYLLETFLMLIGVILLIKR